MVQGLPHHKAESFAIGGHIEWHHGRLGMRTSCNALFAAGPRFSRPGGLTSQQWHGVTWKMQLIPYLPEHNQNSSVSLDIEWD